MNRKRLISYEWVQSLLMVLTACVLVAAGCWVGWFVYELTWAFRCAFGI